LIPWLITFVLLHNTLRCLTQGAIATVLVHRLNHGLEVFRVDAVHDAGG